VTQPLPPEALDRCHAQLGDEGVRRLVDTFYDAMDQLPEAADIRAMHAKDLRESRRKLASFLIGRFGGPQTYVEERGHPRLRARHLPFAIGVAEAGQWLTCMEVALVREVPDEALRSLLRDFFTHVAAHMINRAPDGP
jgi:hemoglobin